ncbi:hypothetical protein SK571_21010 [Lentzea sp. BCCO 10_0798]|uniref:Uncharacterized protein n=1 Tax=Lentzea kristufekii TaxID=3095430 RepID=A0ABU4TUA4_9PSEU|nr:hypothetical protein [Lentzea sp. BCCO 10_0798]MDX8051879.1 hypothetical protein [Lentzea sp. BCCO 10_0798]
MKRSLRFLCSLGISTPAPFVALGDDGSIGVEWDARGNHLHLTFSDDGDEMFWMSSDGQEWEGELKTGSLLDQLIRKVSAQ